MDKVENAGALVTVGLKAETWQRVVKAMTESGEATLSKDGFLLRLLLLTPGEVVD